MAADLEKNIQKVIKDIGEKPTKLIAVSKKQPIESIQRLYDLGQRAFGENHVQELTEKEALLPKDIEWHMVGHLQRNKVKYIAPFVHLIHSVDTFELLKEIDKRAAQNKRVINVLLQLHIADEETKFGFSHDEMILMLTEGEFQKLEHVKIVGLMGIATNTPKQGNIFEEFKEMALFHDGLKKSFFRKNEEFTELSMGMTSDYDLAIEQGSTMIRVGTKIFGARHYPKTVKENAKD
ncbi:MAG: pyridoxal phosphate enzyme (YggS family) [Sphingobacteriales bacterium]|jgi:pyridoxal phosphate enzyme (YggS family)